MGGNNNAVNNWNRDQAQKQDEEEGEGAENERTNERSNQVAGPHKRALIVDDECRQVQRPVQCSQCSQRAFGMRITQLGDQVHPRECGGRGAVIEGGRTAGQRGAGVGEHVRRSRERRRGDTAPWLQCWCSARTETVGVGCKVMGIEKDREPDAQQAKDTGDNQEPGQPLCSPFQKRRHGGDTVIALVSQWLHVLARGSASRAQSCPTKTWRYSRMK